MGGLKLNSFCPLNINLQERACLIVGGGKVAGRKAKLMLGYGALVTVVSPLLSAELQSLVDDKKITYIADVYRPAYLKNKFMVICATDDQELNRSVAAACREQGILVNTVSEPENCTFFLPAQLRKGALSVAVSTDGSSPALARRLRDELQEKIDPAYADFTLFLKNIRPQILRRVNNSVRRKVIFEYLAGAQFFAYFKEEDPARLSRRIEQIISGEIDLDNG